MESTSKTVEIDVSYIAIPLIVWSGDLSTGTYISPWALLFIVLSLLTFPIAVFMLFRDIRDADGLKRSLYTIPLLCTTGIASLAILAHDPHSLGSTHSYAERMLHDLEQRSSRRITNMSKEVSKFTVRGENQRGVVRSVMLQNETGQGESCAIQYTFTSSITGSPDPSSQENIKYSAHCTATFPGSTREPGNVIHIG